MALALRAAAALAASLLCARCAQGSWDALRSDEEQAANEVSLVQRNMVEVRSHLGKSAPENQPAHDSAAASASSKQTAGQLPMPMERNSTEVPVLYMDLDAPPDVRWSNVTKYYLDIGAYPGALLFDEPFSEAMKTLWKTMYLDEEYLAEMRSIVADINDPRVTLESVLFQNMRYELSGFAESPAGLANGGASPLDFMQGCSGLLAAMENGTVVHGRNMDYMGFEVKLPDGRVYHWPEVTVDVVFLQRGRPQFVSAHWPGLVGIHTAMRFDGFSFEQNTRWHGMDSSILSGIAEGGESYVFRARKIMENTRDFDSAVLKLYNANYMAPMYFIVAGTRLYQGAVITVDRSGHHEPTTPLIKRLSPSTPTMKDGKNFTGAGWHLIQTNDDQDAAPLDLRRPFEEVKLRSALQQKVDVPWVLNEMLTPPIFNPATVFTTVYVPGTNYHRTLVHLGNVR